MKDTISKKTITTIREFEQEIIREWNDLSIELAETLVDRMKRRIDSLIEAKDKTTNLFDNKLNIKHCMILNSGWGGWRKTCPEVYVLTGHLAPWHTSKLVSEKIP